MERGAEDVGGLGLGLGTAAQAGLGLEPPGGGGISSNCSLWAVLASGRPWLVAPGGLRLPLGHIPYEIGGPPAFDVGVLGGQSWAPSDLGLAAQQGAGGGHKGLGPLSPYAQEVFWKTRHPSPPGPGWVCGATVPPAPRGHPGHPRPHSLWQGKCYHPAPTKAEQRTGELWAAWPRRWGLHLLCPPCQSPVAFPYSPGLTHMPQGPSRQSGGDLGGDGGAWSPLPGLKQLWGDSGGLFLASMLGDAWFLWQTHSWTEHRGHSRGDAGKRGWLLREQGPSCAELSPRDTPARSHWDTTGPQVLGMGRDLVGGAAPQLLD